MYLQIQVKLKNPYLNLFPDSNLVHKIRIEIIPLAAFLAGTRGISLTVIIPDIRERPVVGHKVDHGICRMNRYIGQLLTERKIKFIHAPAHIP